MSHSMVRQLRTRAGLSQTALAKASGTSQPTISAYESNAKQPSLATLYRLGAAAGFELRVSLVQRSVMSAAVTEARSLLEAGSPVADVFRVLADVSVRLERFGDAVLADTIAADPGSVGEARWDALVGGIVERLARRRGLPVPAWTGDHHRFSPQWWFVAGYPSLRASALVESPPELATRGVFIHEASLTGV